MYFNFRLLLASLMLLLPHASVAAWEDYKEKSLQSTIDEQIDISASADLTYTPGLPQLVLATYTGERRAIPEDREKVVRGWVEMIGQPAEAGNLFLMEMKFSEDGKDHWLPTQKPLIPFFEKEISPGEEVWLYAVWIGATNSEWVFVVNEFKKVIP